MDLFLLGAIVIFAKHSRSARDLVHAQRLDIVPFNKCGTVPALCLATYLSR